LLLLACGAWPQAALAHGEQIIIYVFGTIVAAGALFGLVGGLVCASRGVRMWRGFGLTYGVFLAVLVLVVIGSAVVDSGDVSAAALMEVVSIVLLAGGMLGAVALGIAYALAHYLKRNAKSWS
jgi:hypothetical protein